MTATAAASAGGPGVPGRHMRSSPAWAAGFATLRRWRALPAALALRRLRQQQQTLRRLATSARCQMRWGRWFRSSLCGLVTALGAALALATSCRALDVTGLPANDAAPPLKPAQVWLSVLRGLPVKELCSVARVSHGLRAGAATPAVWRRTYEHLFGEGAPGEWNAATMRRMCRRSELRAAR